MKYTLHSISPHEINKKKTFLFSSFYNSCGHRTVYTYKEDKNSHVRMQGDYVLIFTSNSDTIPTFPSELRQTNSPHRLALSLPVFSLIHSSKRVGLWFEPNINSISAKNADNRVYVCKFSKKAKSEAISYRDFTDYRANSADLDEVAHDEPSHQDLCCLQIQLFSSLVLKMVTYRWPGSTQSR